MTQIKLDCSTSRRGILKKGAARANIERLHAERPKGAVVIAADGDPGYQATSVMLATGPRPGGREVASVPQAATSGAARTTPASRSASGR